MSIKYIAFNGGKKCYLCFFLLLKGRQDVDEVPCTAGEPVAAVYEWLTDSLRDPGCTYELIGPDRQPITPAKGSLKKANLVPTALLNFQRRSAAPQIEPTLKDEVLRLAS